MQNFQNFASLSRGISTERTIPVRALGLAFPEVGGRVLHHLQHTVYGLRHAQALMLYGNTRPKTAEFLHFYGKPRPKSAGLASLPARSPLAFRVSR